MGKMLCFELFFFMSNVSCTTNVHLLFNDNADVELMIFTIKKIKKKKSNIYFLHNKNKIIFMLALCCCTKCVHLLCRKHVLVLIF